MNITENSFENIYQGASFYIGYIGGSQWKSYYLITVGEGVVSQKIGLKLSLDEVKEIISSKEDEEVVSKIKLSKSEYITIAEDEKNKLRWKYEFIWLRNVNKKHLILSITACRITLNFKRDLGLFDMLRNPDWIPGGKTLKTNSPNGVGAFDFVLTNYELNPSNYDILK